MTVKQAELPRLTTWKQTKISPVSHMSPAMAEAELVLCSCPQSSPEADWPAQAASLEPVLKGCRAWLVLVL